MNTSTPTQGIAKPLLKVVAFSAVVVLALTGWVYASVHLFDVPTEVSWLWVGAGFAFSAALLHPHAPTGVTIGYVVWLVLIAPYTFKIPSSYESFLYGFIALVAVLWPYLFVRGFIRAARRPRPETSAAILGLSGYAGSGKDTAAKALIADGWKRVSFADKLRECLYAVNPLIPVYPTTVTEGPHTILRVRRLRDLVDEVGWERAKNENPEVRSLLQRLGTDAGRTYLGDNVWVDAAFKDVPPGTPVVVTDVRFPNEFDAIKARGGHMIRVERPGVGPVNGHASEGQLDSHPFDAVVVNDGDEAQVGEQLRKTASSVA